MRHIRIFGWLSGFCLSSLIACSAGDLIWTAAEREQLQLLSPLPALLPNPTNRYGTQAKAAAFGKRLFFEKRLSANQQLSCASCHEPHKGWTDGRALAQGLAPLVRHTPTLWNVAYQRWQFWDGRADSLWAQALQPIEHPQEMGGTRQHIYQWMQQEPNWKKSYQEVFGPFPSPAQMEHFYSNLGKAFEAFERTLVTKPTPFDRFVAQLKKTNPVAVENLPLAAQRGARLFIGKARCILCHNGPLLSDGEFHNLGLGGTDQGRWAGIPRLKKDPFNGQGRWSDNPSSAVNDKVRYVTLRPTNLGEFKTPSLREVAKTAPYMHDGRFQSLAEVIRFYNILPTESHLGQREESLQPLMLSLQEEHELVAFLESLTQTP